MAPSQRYPWLGPAAVLAARSRRRVGWLVSGTDWCRADRPDDLPELVHRHGSPLPRERCRLVKPSEDVLVSDDSPAQDDAGRA